MDHYLKRMIEKKSKKKRKREEEVKDEGLKPEPKRARRTGSWVL